MNSWVCSRGDHGAGVDSGRMSTVFAKAVAAPGVGFFNKNQTQSRSENFSFYRIWTIDFTKIKLYLSG